jgi:hypothetical protein
MVSGFKEIRSFGKNPSFQNSLLEKFKLELYRIHGFCMLVPFQLNYWNKCMQPQRPSSTQFSFFFIQFPQKMLSDPNI